MLKKTHFLFSKNARFTECGRETRENDVTIYQDMVTCKVCKRGLGWHVRHGCSFPQSSNEKGA